MERNDPAGELLEQRLSAMLEAMPGAESGDVASVHQARVASRRLREALPVLGASADDEALRRARKQVRRVTRALGPVRELDVALANLDEFAARNLAPASAIAHVRRALSHERQKRRTDMSEAVTPERLEKIRKRMTRVSPTAEAVPDEAPLRIRDEAARRVARRAKILRAAVRRAGSLYLPDRLHAVRVAIKKLRYALEIQKELLRSRATRRIRQLKDLQDLLGRLHDLEVLIERVRLTQGESTPTDRRASAALDAFVAEVESECRRLHATYMARQPVLLELANELLADTRSKPAPGEAA